MALWEFPPKRSYRRAAYEAALAAARQARGTDDFAAAWAEGVAWLPEQAVAAATVERRDRVARESSRAKA